MATDRISQVRDFLNLREVRKYSGNKTLNTQSTVNHIEKGITDRTVFISGNPLLLKATEQNIKGNVLTVLLDPITFVALDRLVRPMEPHTLIFDKQTPRVDNLIETLLIKGFEVYEY